MRSKALCVLGVAATFGLAGVASAASVTVNNFSFESPALSPGAYQGDSNNPAGNLPGWVINGTAGAQNFSQNHGYPSGATLPGTADGAQAAYVNGGDIYQDVGPLQPNTTYTLTVAAGNQPGYGPGSTGSIGLVNGSTDAGTSLASASLAQPALQTSNFTDFTTSFTSGASVSGDLTIVLKLVSGNQVDYDNVRLTATSAASTPLPSAAIGGLLLLGGLGMHSLRRRRA